MMSVGHPHENDIISYTDTVCESVGSLRGLGRANAGRRRGRPRWGRMVVSTSFLTFLLQAGSSMTHGLYMPAFLEEFQAGTGLIGWLTSFSAAVMCLGGPIGGVMVKRLGCRPSVMLGGAMMATGNGLASLCTTIVQLFLCLGLVGVLRDSTGNYTLSFYLVGLFFVIAATVMSLRPLIECRRRRRLTMG